MIRRKSSCRSIKSPQKCRHVGRQLMPFEKENKGIIEGLVSYLRRQGLLAACRSSFRADKMLHKCGVSQSSSGGCGTTDN